MYKIKEMFRTLQGEGFNTGRAAVFIRFTGCNLWSGREEDRGEGAGSCSRWCDTDFRGGMTYETPRLVADAAARVWGPGSAERFVVLTGGEPGLQVDAPLIDVLHSAGFKIAIETNGTMSLPTSIDWVTFSPKAGSVPTLHDADEVKIVWPQPGIDIDDYTNHDGFRHRYVSPLDGPDWADNVRVCVEFVKQNPTWRLSLQTHKLIGIP